MVDLVTSPGFPQIFNSSALTSWALELYTFYHSVYGGSVLVDNWDKKLAKN